jgi:multiple sugar transport system permease protein
MAGTITGRSTTVAGTRPKTVRLRWRAWAVPYLFLAPGLLLFVVFRVYPLFNGLVLSFTNARVGRSSMAFTGTSNYERLLEDARFLLSLWNTLVYTVASTLPLVFLPLLLAVLLNRGLPLRALLRSAFFFPFTLSVVTVGLTWLWLLEPVVGPLNFYLRQFGVAAPAWLGDPSTAMAAIVLTSVWWVTGYYLVIYLAALQDIPQHLYEAAAIDGASAWRSFWSITVPLLRPTFLFVIVIHIIGSFQIFGQVFVLTRGGPGDATRTVVQHLYETAFVDAFHLGSASAMAWVLFVVILVFSIVQFRLLRGRAEY